MVSPVDCRECFYVSDASNVRLQAVTVWVLLQIGFTGMSFGPASVDSSEKQKWVEQLGDQKADMVRRTFNS